MTNRDGKRSGGGILFLTGLVVLALVAQYVSTKPTATPAASQAITRWVAQERRLSALGRQETNEGYVIDPALAKRMLADTAITVRATGVRGFSDNVIVRASVTAPGADGAEQSATRYFALRRASPDDWTVTGEAKARDWYIKIW